MSAWSDWRCGALSDDEYRSISAYEDREDKYLEELMYNNRDRVSSEEDD